VTARKVEWGAEAAEDALRAISTRDLRTVEFMFGDAMLAVSGSLRGLFVAAPGHELICADYSAIEAVVTAMLAGEQWRIDVFRTHGKIYEMSAAKTFGLSFEELMAHAGYTPAELALPMWWTHDPLRPGTHHPLRKKGKVTELALGFLGWIGALMQMGFTGTEQEAKEMVLAWRAASPSIVYLGGGQKLNWQPCMHGLEGMAVLATQNPGQTFPVMRRDGTPTGLSYVVEGDALYCTLLDGTALTYHRPRLKVSAQTWRGMELSYEGWNTNPKMGGAGWQRMNTYSGKLLENVVQASANRILRHSQANLEAAGYPIVQHVYDENVSEVPAHFGSCEEYLCIMNRMPAWASDWPIRAAGAWRGRRYRK
jgi:DNA polymerase